jgi:2-C-methyl-D-erythritol 2,4-cyclodiphosphate synthase
VQIRTGIGIDVHRLVEGRPMIMGGLDFPDEPKGPKGHSDGDVVCHAICDALLSAAGLGDLGTNYGTDDPAWGGASGVSFLTATSDRVREAGFSISNVAVQLIANTPRLGSRRLEAEQLLSQAIDAPVSVAATTTDGLGLTGRGEGVAAVASALLIRGRLADEGRVNDEGIALPDIAGA